MFKKILVGFDGSPSANDAYSLAEDLALRYGAQLKVLAVARPPEFGSEVETEAVLAQSRKHYLHALHPLKARCQLGEAVSWDVQAGHPAERILVESESWGADLIVIGHKGRGLVARLLTGSVAKQVIDHARCAVLVARATSLVAPPHGHPPAG